MKLTGNISRSAVLALCLAMTLRTALGCAGHMTDAASPASSGGGEMTVREKILNGLPYSDDEWNAYLSVVHGEVAGVTRPFAHFATSRGPNTYEVLLQSADLARFRSILDLGCGDGVMVEMMARRLGAGKTRLLGVDIVASEIAAARKLVPPPIAEFFAEPIQKMSLATGSVELMLSHLVLMLTLPLTPARDEIARVMKSGGRLHAVVTGPIVPGSQLAALMGKVREYVRRHYPHYNGIRSGDPRMDSAEGIASVFSTEAGFEDLKLEDYAMLVTGTPEEIWRDYVATTHTYFVLPPELRKGLEAEVLGWLRGHVDGTGKVHLEDPLRMIQVTRSAR